MVGTKAQSELIPLVEQNSITKNSCNEQFYLFDFSGESNVNRFAIFAVRAFDCVQTKFPRVHVPSRQYVEAVIAALPHLAEAVAAI